MMANRAHAYRETRGIDMKAKVIAASCLLAAACVPAGPEGADALYVGECDITEMRRRAITIVDNADPGFAERRGQYRMNFVRRPDTRELVLFHTPRPGGQAEGTTGGYVLTFEAESCKFDRLTANR